MNVSLPFPRPAVRWLASLALVTVSASTGGQAGGAPAARMPPIRSHLLLVVDKTAKELLFVDVRENKVVNQLSTGEGPNPHEVAVTPDGRLAFVAIYAAPGNAGRTIQVVDVMAAKEVARIDLGDYRAPHGLAVSRSGRLLYATVEGSQALLEIDIAERKVLRAFKTNQQVSHMVALSVDEKKVYVANIESGTATAVDLASGTVKQIVTGAGAEGIAARPRSQEVWVTNRAANTVSVIDTRTDTVTHTIQCPAFPIRITFDPSGSRAYVSCMTSSEVAVINANSKAVGHRIAVGQAPIGLLMSPEGDRLYAANTAAGTVTVIDPAARKVIATIAAGREPDGLAYAAF